MVKYCPRCGYPNADDAKFCIKCGYPLPLSSILQGGNAPQPPPQPSPQQPSSPQHNAPALIAIVGVVMVVIVLLVVFLVALPSTSSHGLNALASTASSEFGGSWKTVNSGVISYAGNGMYKVTFSNGSTIYENYASISVYLGSLVKTHQVVIYTHNNNGAQCTLTFGSNSCLNLTSSCNVEPAKIVFAELNGTVNGEKATIIVAGIYYNVTPNPACKEYYEINSSYAFYSLFASYMASKYEEVGITFSLSSSNGSYILYSAINNATIASQYLCANVTKAGEFGKITKNEAILVLTINLSPTMQQMEALTKQVQSCL